MVVKVWLKFQMFVLQSWQFYFVVVSQLENLESICKFQAKLLFVAGEVYYLLSILALVKKRQPFTLQEKAIPSLVRQNNILSCLGEKKPPQI